MPAPTSPARSVRKMALKVKKGGEEQSATLKLSLKKEAFDVMVSGEKKYEYREKSAWMHSRLWNEKEAAPRQYALVEFKNGRPKTAPTFYVKYLGFDVVDDVQEHYSNGLQINISGTEHFRLKLGDVTEVHNVSAAENSQSPDH
eukprot:gnl/TRDRNA2_/TRDRNA2_198247_c0_seq1.p1 gnl/TRDRNA2_/TRDRNA2_198247_c0~~gnl/TRDRNA2_/TRDRNA2_198247_c0_seq1.p1  ORF type:complete len:144 (+),score=39.76 gnl/TRDRNA2_/TRDRNA2_198247_c0_seq1:55-486(+)